MAGYVCQLIDIQAGEYGEIKKAIYAFLVAHLCVILPSVFSVQAYRAR